MSDDDLGLGFRHDRRDRHRRPNYTARRVTVVVLTLVVLGLVALGALLVSRGVGSVRGLFHHSAADYAGAGSGSVVVQVHPGDTLSQIGTTLQHDDVVASAASFTKAATNDPKATSIGPGFYRLHHHMQASLALSLLLDPTSQLASRVVIPEGMRMDAILQAVAKSTKIPLADLKRAAKNPAALGVPSWGSGHSLEGFLFPATYTFGPDTTATQALRAMVARFNQVATSIDLAGKAQAQSRSPYDVLVLASIVQREGRLDSDFPRIAEVFSNRLRQGIPLGSDATLYYIKPLGYGLLTESDLRIDSPYNTRLHAGLPPTPIVSPGQLALEAALNPPSGPYLYFVTIDKAGHAAFATNLSDFNKLVAQSRRNGVR